MLLRLHIFSYFLLTHTQWHNHSHTYWYLLFSIKFFLFFIIYLLYFAEAFLFYYFLLYLQISLILLLFFLIKYNVSHCYVFLLCNPAFVIGQKELFLYMHVHNFYIIYSSKPQRGFTRFTRPSLMNSDGKFKGSWLWDQHKKDATLLG